MTVTKEQALAFVEALTGYTAVAENGSDDCGELKSPHAKTHLEAALGTGYVPTYYDVSRAISRSFKAENVVGNRAKTANLADYLAAVAEALREAMKPVEEPRP